MKVLISTYGARGDVAPYVAIARELKILGARPVIATSRHWQAFIEGAEIEWADCPPQTPQGRDLARVMEKARGDEHLFRDWIVPALRENYRALDELAATADVLVTHTLPFAGPIVAAKRRMPWVSSTVSPMSLLEPRLAPALPVAPWAAELRGLNRLLLRLLRRQFGMWLRPVQQFRRELGLPAGDNAIWHDGHSSQLALRLWSPLFCAPGTKGAARAVGFCFSPAQPLAPETANWIEAGEAPLVFCAATGCGGAAWEARAKASARQLGRRALLLGALEDSQAPALMTRQFAPLEAVLPHAAAVVMGGGIGALSIAWRAATPMLLVPQAHDQADNARRAEKLGIARIARGDWTRQLEALLNDENLRVKVSATGAIMTQEAGAKTAALAILAQI